MKVLYVSSFPPQRCGIATYTWNLADAVNKVDEDVHPSFLSFELENRLSEASGYHKPDIEVLRYLRKESRETYRLSAELINNSNVNLVHLQHEYGLFGGAFGSYVRELVENLQKPLVVTFHSVKPHPSVELKEVTEKIANNADAIIVHTKSGAELLTTYYKIGEDKIHIIPHGTPEINPDQFNKDRILKELEVSGNPIISSLGFVRPSKGLEYAVKAMRHIKKIHPEALLLIVGQTHPNHLAVEGEKHREWLVKLADKLGVKENVKFINRFVEEGNLINYLLISDFYVIPYVGREQISSGTLAYALGCGKAVISTPFRHAVETLLDQTPDPTRTSEINDLIFGRRGVIVPFKDEEAVAKAVLTLMKDRGRKLFIEKQALDFAATTNWRKIGERHLSLYYLVISSRQLTALNSLTLLKRNV